MDVSRNTELWNLRCGANQLTTLDVSRNTALYYFYCDDNQLTALNLKNNTALHGVNVSSNRFTTAALNALFETLHDDLIMGEGMLTQWIRISGNPGATDSDPAVAQAKGWTVEGFTGAQYGGVYTFSDPAVEGAEGTVYIYPETDGGLLFYLNKAIGAPSYQHAIIDGRIAMTDGKGVFRESHFDKTIPDF